MEIPSFLDEEVLTHPMYWLLTAGAEIALMIGFKAQSAWGVGVMPFWQIIMVLAFLPIATYIVMMKMI